jgi:ribosomal protein S13
MVFFRMLRFINFNYDRCLEFFLWRGLQQLYGIGSRHAAEIVSKVRIFHPYGSVGPLQFDSVESGIEFGATEVDCFEAADRIKTYSEKVDEGEDLASIREEIAKARLIVFLGIHFHEQNIRLVTPTTKTAAENIFGTALGFSDEDQSVVEDQLQVFLSKKYRDGVFLGGTDGPIRLGDLTCSQLFDRYSKTLPRPAALEPVGLPLR